LIEREITFDQTCECARHGRLQPRGVDRLGEQWHGFERFDRLPHAPGNLLRANALGQQLTRSAVAALWG
jgi:hypothetical protein